MATLHSISPQLIRISACLLALYDDDIWPCSATISTPAGGQAKCDGVKPVCGPCRRHPKEDECEYSDGPGRSRTKALEDQVSRLEARLQELENPDASTPSVKLHDPYAHYNETQRISKSPPLYIPAEPTMTLAPLSPFSPTSTSSSLPSGRHWNTFSALHANTESTGSSGPSTSPIRPLPATSPFLGAEEPSFLLIQNLLDKFLPHAAEFGFFLHVPTFRSSTLLSAPFGHPSRPTPALLSVVYLWGVHLSHSEALLLQEQAFLTRALQHVATDMFGTHPNRILHTMQAQVLLAYYFFRTGRFLEAKWQTGSAISLALGSGFHKLRSANMAPPATIGLSHDAPVYLDLPQTNLEEGERINGFWAVFTLHKLISVALEPPFNVCGALEAPGIQIDVPWPLDMPQYLDGLLTPEVRGNSTQREFQAFAAAFQTVHRLIEQCRAQLPAIAGHEISDPSLRTLILAHALVDAAIIKLHGIFAYADSSSKQHCLTAARNIITCGGVNLAEVGYLNPIMGTLWMIACHVFIDEVSRMRTQQPAWTESSTSAGGGDLTEEELMEYLRNGLTHLSLYSEDNVLTRYQLTKVQEAYSAI
ncbi:hypothetical protein CC1G_00878 [Coprinopsis cinerea okayama7|uniref:Xylanolytic transcriptional activator regulatory domain-containing protein n=1 Tax=Coprinopsis cinerea (strain Okayama-7 / 130 / ATCC MYA-4618 / FGSC 9003) TaxID=240176 RepID=A8N903_COPC7|nr:hypothetical protein CC1G_00878 [Coprinopsis cinerea okayama7\|eukprot:XP_001831331.2 hypothetical protein CC1G_00878 [Coprinopsis cinerea okayama7\